MTRKTWVDKTTGAILTYKIKLLEAFDEYKKNKEFRKFINTGYFIFCEDRYVICHPKYITRKEGKIRLTDYAKANEKECCIVFTLEDKEGVDKNIYQENP